MKVTVVSGLNGFNQKLTMSKFHIQEHNNYCQYTTYFPCMATYVNGLQCTSKYLKVLTRTFKYFKYLK